MNRIKMLREERNMTQEELGAVLSCRDATVSRYENEKLGLDVRTINTLCNLFNCTADYLLYRSNTPTLELSESDAALLRAYHAASLRDRGIIDQILQAYAEDDQQKNAI